MLFLIIMEVLHALIWRSDVWGLFQQVGMCRLPHWASLYGDDLIMFVCLAARDLLHNWCIFSSFEGASGLGCNMAKCQLGPICCNEDQLAAAMTTFPYLVVDFLMKYLGIPLSVRKLPKSAWQPLVDKVAHKLPIWKGNFMHHSDRLTLIKTTMAAIPVYVSTSLGLPPWVIKALIKIMTDFLWT
jgi:hypothetical protein